MLIPIGFFGGGAAAGAYELISTAYGNGSSTSISFSSIVGTYKHLQLRILAQGSQNGNLSVRYNSDTGSNYSLHRLEGNGTTIASAGGGPYTLIEINDGMSDDTVAGEFGATIIDILDYASTTKYKTQRAFSGSTTDAKRVGLYSGLWMNMAAITSITLIGDYAFSTPSRFSLYGIKG